MQRINENRPMENRPLGDLFGDLAADMSNLVRQEVALAKLEVTQKAKYLGRNVGYLVVGGAVAYAGMLAVIAAIIMLLDRVMPAWGAALGSDERWCRPQVLRRWPRQRAGPR